MIMRKFVVVSMLLLLICTISFADPTLRNNKKMEDLTNDDIFPELIDNTYFCSDNCYAIYRIENPFNEDVRIKVYHTVAKGKIDNLNAYVYTTTEKTKTVQNCASKASVNGNDTYCDSIKYSQETYYEESLEEIENKYITIEGGESTLIKITGNIGDYNINDWIPNIEIKYNGKPYKFKNDKWALWQIELYPSVGAYSTGYTGNTFVNPTYGYDGDFLTAAETQSVGEIQTDLYKNFTHNALISPRNITLHTTWSAASGGIWSYQNQLFNWTSGAWQPVYLVQWDTGIYGDNDVYFYIDENMTRDFVNRTEGLVMEHIQVYAQSGSPTIYYYETSLRVDSFHNSSLYWKQKPVHQYVEYSLLLDYTLNASSPITGIANLYINDTTNFNAVMNGSFGDLDRNVRITTPSTLAIGTYPLMVTLNGTINQTLNSSFYITLSDTSPPTWNQTPTDQTFYLDKKTYQVNATDPFGLEVYSLNDTSNYTINSLTGLITSISTENVFSSLIISVNDTNGNMQNESVKFINIINPFFNCSSGVVALNLTVTNETNMVNLTADIQITITISNRTDINFSVGAKDASTFPICIFDSSLSFLTNIEIVYSSDEYATRRLFFNDFLLTNSSQALPLYMVTDSVSTKTTYSVNDNFGNPIKDIIIEAWLWDGSTNDFKLVAMGRTDSNGETPIELEHDKNYQYKLKIGSILKKLIGKELLHSDTPSPFIISEASDETAWFLVDNFDYTCNYNNETKIQSCTILDKSGLTTNFKWDVYAKRNGTTGWVHVCDKETASNPASFDCDVTGYIDKIGSRITYGVHATFKGKDYVIFSRDGDYAYFYDRSGYGATGVFSAIILILGAVLAASFHPVAAMFAGEVALLGVYYLKLIPLPLEGLMGATIAIAVFSVLIADILRGK